MAELLDMYYTLFSYTYGTKYGYGFGDVVQKIAYFAPVLGIALGYNMVVKERNSHSLNVLLTHPLYRDNIITGKFLGAVTTLVLVVFLTITVIFGTSLLITGKIADFYELNRLFIFGFLTFLYLLVFLTVGIFTSVIAKSEIDSLTYGIVVWLNLCIVYGVIIMFIASAVTGQSLYELNENQQFRDVIFQLQKFSPIHHYGEATVGSPDLSFGGFRVHQDENINGVLDTRYILREWLAQYWDNVAILLIVPLLLLITSYLAFLRSDV